MKHLMFLGLLAVVHAEDTKQIAELANQAQDSINQLQSIITSIQNELNTTDQEAAQTTYRNMSDTLVTKIQNYIHTVSEEMKGDVTPEVEKFWADLKVKLDKVVEDINAKKPGVEASIEQFQKQFEEGIQELVNETKSLADQVNESTGAVKVQITAFAGKAMDLAVEATQNLHDQLKEAAEAAEKRKKE